MHIRVPVPERPLVTRLSAVVAPVALAVALAVSTSAAGANECDGLQVCVPVAGPWVAVPVSSADIRPRVEYQVTCPRGHVAGGLDARLSERAIDVSFLGALGSPVNPGITTSRSVVFVASYVGRSGLAPTFRPFVGCMPAAGSGSRVPTSVGAVRPGRPTVRRVQNVRVHPGTTTVVQRCASRERLVGAAHAVGFFTRTPPGPDLVRSVRAAQAVRGGRVVVRVSGDAELAGVRAVLQVQAVCAVTR
jgi:hypothetical protein